MSYTVITGGESDAQISAALTAAGVDSFNAGRIVQLHDDGLLPAPFSVDSFDVSQGGSASAPPGTTVIVLNGANPGQTPFEVHTGNNFILSDPPMPGDGPPLSEAVRLAADSANDTLWGGTANDTLISASHHANTIWAGDVADTIKAGSADGVAGNSASLIMAGRFADSHDTVYAADGGPGDTISLTQGDNLVYGAKNAHITAGSGFDTIVGGTGPETINGGGQTEIYATGKETINTKGSDTVIGVQGSDTINSNGGSATLLVGHGNQTLNLSNGANDSIFGGVASDPTKGVGTVSVNEAASAIASQTLDQTTGATQISFSDGNKLTVAHATVQFTDDPNKHTLA